MQRDTPQASVAQPAIHSDTTSNNPIPEPSPTAASDRTIGNMVQSEKEAINHEARAIPSGVPFPAMPGPIGINPAPPTSPDFPMAEKQRSASSSNSSEIKPSKSKGFHFGKRRAARDEDDKTPKQKEDEANKIKPVGIFQLFRYAQPIETTFNIIGIILAIASGAAQPLMTLIFGRLTTDFTNFGQITKGLAAGGIPTAAQIATLEAAKADLKTSAGRNALYLMAIGIGMFLTTWAYMFIWNWTGEVNAKRIREKYLHATLRQDVRLGRIQSRRQS